MKEMNNYSRILLQTCYSDVFLLTAALLTQPIYVVDDNVSKIVLNGPFLNPQLGCVAYVVWLFSIFFSIVGMSVQFVYRYITLCQSV
ncbi:serpentine type 7TM GPCR chemoreceptor srd domain-containing protein [Ditylenchus destructor]|nr:serpentine type 7TM GPCR chemoreceptor srd domain-containing protein [Ditylenchus destructor]